MNAPLRKVPAGAIAYASRPKVYDMTVKQWGPLVAVRPGGKPFHWFTHPGHHDGAEFLANAEAIRRRTKLGLEVFCPLCKGSK